MTAPPVVPESTWVAVQPFPSAPAGGSFVSKDRDGDRLRLAYFRVPEGAVLYVRVWFGPETQGPPGQVHGGAMAAILDEAMGGVCWMMGHPAVAARITINFLHMLPLGADTTVEAWIDVVDGRKIHTRARLLDPAGRVMAEGDGLFVVLTPDQLTALSGKGPRLEGDIDSSVEGRSKDC